MKSEEVKRKAPKTYAFGALAGVAGFEPVKISPINRIVLRFVKFCVQFRVQLIVNFIEMFEGFFIIFRLFSFKSVVINIIHSIQPIICATNFLTIPTVRYSTE